jgi:hypothetical protein
LIGAFCQGIFLEDAKNYLISDQFIYFVYHIYKNPHCAGLAEKRVRIFGAGLTRTSPPCRRRRI